MAEDTAPVIGEVNKGGRTWFAFTLDRTKDGLTIRVKTVREVEDFFQGISTQRDMLDLYGRYWMPSPKGRVIEVYNLKEGKDVTGGPGTYSVNVVSEQLIQHNRNNPNQPTINLSFLRFVGISEGDGVAFTIAGPWAKTEINDLKAKLTTAAAALARDYITPMHVHLTLSSQTW